MQMKPSAKAPPKPVDNKKKKDAGKTKGTVAKKLGASGKVGKK